MRFAGVLLLVVALVSVVEPRPPREKRGIKICSARDVKFMATFVCNLHKRSVRSVDAKDFALEEDGDDDLALFAPARSIPRRQMCNDNGRDCSRQIEASELTNSQLNNLKAWLAQNGYVAEPEHHNLPMKMKENDRPIFREEENGDHFTRGDLKVIMDDLIPSTLKAAVAKRGRDVDWPLVTSLTLGDIRKNCCVRQCRVEDFYGACS